MYRRPCGLMDKAPDFGSGDCRFESCHGRNIFKFSKKGNVKFSISPIMTLLFFIVFINILKHYRNFWLLRQQAFLELGVYCLEIIAITESKTKRNDRDRTQTCNPQIRSLVPYPLGHMVVDERNKRASSSNLEICRTKT